MWGITFLLSVIYFTSTIANAEKEKVKVSIYYEALCGDSIVFVTDQLNASYSEIGNYIDLDLIPYGKASQRKENGTWHFICQHGPEECHGNKMQACAIHQEKSQENTVAFVSCVMGSENRANDSQIKACAEACGFSWEDMEKCSKNGLGDNLLAAYGTRTHDADPIITFVPTLFFNDKYDPFIQAEALRNFVAAVCSVMKVKPAVCPENNINHYWWL